MNNLDPYVFYFELPIYTPISLGSPNNQDFIDLINFKGRIDAYNPTLGENTTYTVSPCNRNKSDYFGQVGGMEYCVLSCVRTQDKFYIFIFYDKKEYTIQKIGQFPSIADYHISQIKKYDKVLPKEKLKEFTRAIGLAANGVGIGSFVYLRRIFEDLIQEAHLKAQTATAWDEENYQKQKMSEKIGLLQQYLPEFLVQNKSLYAILSVGIHSLKEEDCLSYFETVKVGIELILDEKVESYQRQKKITEAKGKIDLLTGKIRKSK